MSLRTRFACICFVCFGVLLPLQAQTGASSSTTTVQVPRLIRLSGMLTPGSGLTGDHSVVGVTFSLYAEQTGGAPLWQETQSVELDSVGHYTVLLGSTQAEGLPAELFTSVQAQWLGVQAEREAEQARIMLVSVPFALKAGDAETLGGKPPSAYAAAPPAATTVGPSATASSSATASPTAAASPKAAATPSALDPTVTGEGTRHYIPQWLSPTTLGSSNIFTLGTPDSSGDVGIGFPEREFPTNPFGVVSNFGIQGDLTVPTILGRGRNLSASSGGTASRGWNLVGVQGDVQSTGAGVLGTADSGYGAVGFVTGGIGVYGETTVYSPPPPSASLIDLPSAGGFFVNSAPTTSSTPNPFPKSFYYGLVGRTGIYNPWGVGVKGQIGIPSDVGNALFENELGQTVFHPFGLWGDVSFGGVGVAGTVDLGVSIMGLNNDPSNPAGNFENYATTGNGNGVTAETSTPNGAGVAGMALATSGAAVGVTGTTASPAGTGVYGNATDKTGAGVTVGVEGTASNPTGYGVYGVNNAVFGGVGVFGQNKSANGALGAGVEGSNASPGGFGVEGVNTDTTGSSTGGTGGIGVYGTTTSPGGYGIYGFATTGTTPPPLPAPAPAPVGVAGTTNAPSGYGVYGVAQPTNTSGNAYGVYGQSNSGDAVHGLCTGVNCSGVAGVINSNGTGQTEGIAGVNNSTSGLSNGVYGHTASPGGVAGLFENIAGGLILLGRVNPSTNLFTVDGSGSGFFANNLQVNGTLTVSGNLIKPSGSFKIDDPIDPANKYLSHSFVESPDMMNIYNGIVRLDAQGEAWVVLPDYFEALNRDFRYQLTSIGLPQPRLYIATEVKGNRFRIAGGRANAKVSWQVTGIRHDAWADAHRIPDEEDKPADLRGTYMHPELFESDTNKTAQVVQPNR